ncbi:hypothetical protein QJS66_03130 [Kocuria rhizophila]|nr:hypothetical protein QJS66_03130 [Kocuria rhizophila]
MDQANEMAKATKASAAQQMIRRAERLVAGVGKRVRTRSQPSASQARGLRQDPRSPRRAVQVLRLTGGYHGRGPRDRPGLPRGGARARRCGPSHPAADARGPGRAGRR